MRKIISTIAAMTAAGAVLLSAPALAKATGEERLAKMLEGRQAGEPVSCITLFDSHNLQVIDKTALVYKSGGTIYVNRPRDPNSLRPHDVLIMKRTSSQFCKQDMVNTADQTTGMYTGSVFLGDFVPYRKAEG
ncbi:MAG: hypothetical protein WCY92_08010 [Novosphingobium sp.]|uniref:hypothetical protein n=1 Tax=Tsuneonella sp. CC-YZS046 TaxID=3042152 RepID=UPI002D767288|nr:hypothetical protein [Tsuneonella sp. CC-YZS046]WRO66400.1 hypothetical protein U8326_15400 [Tsuneonella sp. CC-YZS046]